MQMYIITKDAVPENIEIPYLVSDEESRELLEDFARTVTGTARKDTYNGAKRKFTTIHTRLDPTQWRKIFNYMDSTLWGAVSVYFEHLKGSMLCYIQIRAPRQRGKRLTAFSNDLRELNIDIVEV